MVFEQGLLQFKIMGVINITPDSFSDGGSYFSPHKALARAIQLIEEGADFVDLGAESTRPGAEPLTHEAEWQRLEPVLRLLNEHDILPSVTVDTMKLQTMERLLDWKIAGINDIGGIASPDILKALRKSGVRHHISMHMHGNPQVMQKQPLDAESAVMQVGDFLRNQQEKLLSCGFKIGEFWLDPGIGFGKCDRANLLLMTKVYEWQKDYRIAMGVSRKSLIGRILDIKTPQDRDDPSKMLEWGLVMAGACLIRTHEVKPLVKIRNIILSG